MALERKVAGVPVPWWVAGAVALLLIVGLVAVGIAGWRSIAATRAQVNKLQTALEEANSESAQLQGRLKTVSAERDELEKSLQGRIDEEVATLQGALAQQAETDSALQTQVLLLKASSKALKARIHLGERDAGLAKRDLRDCEAIVAQAMDSADGDTRTSLQEIKGVISELKDSIEAKTFPLTTVEVLIERIEALVAP